MPCSRAELVDRAAALLAAPWRRSRRRSGSRRRRAAGTAPRAPRASPRRCRRRGAPAPSGRRRAPAASRSKNPGTMRTPRSRPKRAKLSRTSSRGHGEEVDRVQVAEPSAAGKPWNESATWTVRSVGAERVERRAHQDRGARRATSPPRSGRPRRRRGPPTRRTPGGRRAGSGRPSSARGAASRGRRRAVRRSSPRSSREATLPSSSRLTDAGARARQVAQRELEQPEIGGAQRSPRPGAGRRRAAPARPSSPRSPSGPPGPGTSSRGHDIAAADDHRRRHRDGRSRLDGDGAPERPVVIEVRGLEKTFRIPTHRVDSFKERATHPFRRIEYREQRVAARRLVRRPPGRVLRDRRPQRLRQEHAAEDHVEHLPRRPRPDPRGRAAGAVHRARRRLQPRAELARERRPQRRDDGPRPARGGSAGSTRSSTSPSCASSPTSSSRTTRRG